MGTVRPLCLALVDGLGDSAAARDRAFAWLDHRGPYRPGMGYSFTQKRELLQGRLPREQGVLNVWQCERPAPVRLTPPRRLLSRFRDAWPLADKIVHFGLARLFPHTANIPFEFRGCFRPYSIDPYEPRPDSILAGGDWACMIGDHDRPLRDRGVLDRMDAAAAGGAPRLFGALAELDHIGHVKGPEHAVFREHIRRLDRLLDALAARFLAQHPDGTFVLLSDHGMLPVHDARPLPAALFDLPGGLRAPYWLDSTMLRAWTPTDGDTARLRERLGSLPWLRVLTPAEREEHGIEPEAFGALIALTAPGIVFRPDHFGVGRPPGMHGYHPDTPGYAGVLGWRRGPQAPAITAAPPATTLEVYTFLRRLLAAPA